MFKDYLRYVVDELQVIGLQVAEVVPALLVALVIVGITLVLAKLARNITGKVLRLFGVNVLSKKVGLDEFIKPSALAAGMSELIGIVVYWLLLFIGVTYALGIVGFRTAETLLGNLMLYLPKVFAGVVLLVIGVHIAVFLGNLAERAAAGARVGYAKAIGNTVKGIVLLITAISIIEELAVSIDILKVSLYIVLACAASVFTLIIGIGGIQIGKEFLASIIVKETVKPGMRILWHNETVVISEISAFYTKAQADTRLVHIPNSALMRDITIVDESAATDR